MPFFHAAKAALHARGIAAETHPSVRSMFGLHLIKTGEIEKDYAVHLAHSFDDRLAADYDPEIDFSGKEARKACRQTRQFLARIRRFLLGNGFTVGELRKRPPGRHLQGKPDQLVRNVRKTGLRCRCQVAQNRMSRFPRVRG